MSVEFGDNTGLNFTETLHKDTYPAIDPSKRDLSGRYVFITGSSKGIGREIALSYASAGATGIGIGARSDLEGVKKELLEAAAAAKKPAPQIVSVTLDVTDKESVSAAAAVIDKAFPRLDILVNNAGYLELPAKLADTDPDEWWKVFEVNVKGTYLVTRAFLPQMLKSGDKQIVNLSSRVAHLVVPSVSAYQMTKLAVLRFTEFVDVEYADQGVVTFAIHPGGMLTDLGKRLPAEYHAALTETPKLAAGFIVSLTEKKRDWLAGRYLSATWDIEQLLAKEKEIVDGGKLKVRMVV